MTHSEPPGFRAYIEARSPALVRTAYLLTGDHGLAEDLVQSALVRVWPHWEQIKDGHPDAYIRTTMIRLQSSWRGRRWRGEVPSDRLPDRAGPTGPSVELHVDLVRALALLPVGQRQIVVLRYCEDRPVAEIAQALGVSEGNVKSQASRGLAALRGRLGSMTEVTR